MSHLQTYIFTKPNNQVISTQRRRRRWNCQIAAKRLNISSGNYREFEAGRCGLSLEQFQRLELPPFQERLCLRASCRRNWISPKTICPRLDNSLSQSLQISEEISRKTRRRLSPASPLAKLADRYQSDDDFAGRVRQQLLTSLPEECESDQSFYNYLVASLAEHRIHVLNHPLSSSWLGYSLSPAQSIIVVNCNLPVADRTYSLIAQLGDLLSSHAISRPITLDRIDHLINAFAAHFIVPLKKLKTQLNQDQIQLDHFRRQFRGSSSEVVRQQLKRLRPEIGQSRRWSRLISLLSVRSREPVKLNQSTTQKLLDLNGLVYLDELAANSDRNWNTKLLPKGLFGYQPEHNHDCQQAAHLLNRLRDQTNYQLIRL